VTNALPGGATSRGTTAYARELELRGLTLAPNAFRRLGRTAWFVGKIGYGTYRVHADVEEHARTLLYAVLHGCNVVDTSSNYTDGGSERLVGNALRALIESQGIARENVVVVTKAGYIQGSNYARAAEREREGQPFPEVVKYADGLWHCIHPEWLEDQLRQSLERTQLDRLDAFLLHNPEYFLSDAARRRPGAPIAVLREEFYDRIRRAFEAMERFVAEGRISYYGISSNTFASSPESVEHVSLVDALRCAREAAFRTLGDPNAHHFGVAQLPFNLFEAGAFAEDVASDGRSFLDVARDADIGVLVNRPLNAIVGSQLIRLAEYAEEAQYEPPLEACARLASTERDIVLALKDWRLWEDLRQNATTRLFFDVGESLKGVLPQIEGRLPWVDIFEHVVAPSVVACADRASEKVADTHRDEWTRLLSEYQAAILAFARSATAHYNRIENGRKASLKKALTDALGAASDGWPLSRIALNAVASVPGVSTVLCGMKRDDYVVDGTGLFALADFGDPYAAFRAVAGQRVVG
jgi:hypothetical protein